jgi:hypothetical protein
MATAIATMRTTNPMPTDLRAFVELVATISLSAIQQRVR